MNKIIAFDNSIAKISSFENGTEVKEFHVIIQITTPKLSFQEQLGTLFNTEKFYNLPKKDRDAVVKFIEAI